MAQCDYCQKKASKGNQIETRGKAKYLGGVGTKITGITRREFKPNLQRVKITTPGGTNKYVRICTRCLKAGVVRKAVKQAPFKLPVSVQHKGQPVKGGAPAPAATGNKPAAKGSAPTKPAATKPAAAAAPAKGKK
jgi:large subunit ribosomal protein L28